MKNLKKKLRADWVRNRSLYALVIPVVAFYILFNYKPIYGAIIAFQDYTPRLGISGSEWVGFDNFKRFFSDIYFGRLMKNTLLLSFKNVTQTITYLPHFISMIVVCGMLTDFSLSTGLFNDIIAFFGGERHPLLQDPSLYRTIYILSGIWQQVGWGTIIYLSALAGVDSQLYEAAQIDGANKWKQTLHVTLPGIAPTIITMFILKIGKLMSMGYEKTILLYNPSTYETADIISSYVYRIGLLDQDWSYSTAIGLFNSVINFILLILANKLSKKFSQTSLW